MNKRCINPNSIQVKELSDELGLKPIIVAAKIAVWQDKNNTYDFPSANDLVEGINYSIKAVDILLSDKAIQVFDKGRKNNWSLDKILTELNIPKEQKQLILDLGIVDREQLALELSSKYGYTIEINTAKEIRTLSQNEAIQRQGNDKIEEGDIVEYQGNEYSIYEVEQNFSNEDMMYNFSYTLSPIENVFDPETNPTGIDVVFNITSDKFKVKRTKNNDNSSYYSNLTVPGGTNYTENEISTPLITPSIKGHAQFSTDKGIGWFRSDEQIDTNKENSVQKYIDLGYDLEIAQDKAYQDLLNNLGSKTRRILEVQSDLFQKGRDNKDIVSGSFEGKLFNRGLTDSNKEEFLNAKNKGIEVDFEAKEYKNSYNYGEYIYIEQFNYGENEPERYLKYPSNDNNKQNQFLQLLNKDNNWVTFFIKSIIQDSAKQTVTEVQEEDVEAKVKELENSGLLKIKCS